MIKSLISSMILCFSSLFAKRASSSSCAVFFLHEPKAPQALVKEDK